MPVEISLTQFLTDQMKTNSYDETKFLFERISKFLYPRWHTSGLALLLQIPYWKANRWVCNVLTPPPDRYFALASALEAKGQEAFLLANKARQAGYDAIVEAKKPRKLTGACDPNYIAAQRAAKELTQADL